jgi:hypothetical protein
MERAAEQVLERGGWTQLEQVAKIHFQITKRLKTKTD